MRGGGGGWGWPVVDGGRCGARVAGGRSAGG